MKIKGSGADDEIDSSVHMSGLYQRALQIYRQSVGLHLVPKGEQGAVGGEISPADRELVDRQINELLAKDRVRLEPDSFKTVARRSGAGLPLLINGLALGVLIAVLLVSSFLLNRQEQTLASKTGSILSAESKLIETLRQESERELAQRDRVILDAQAKLTEVSQERERLRTETAETIRRREEELAAELARTLQTERSRLQSQGLSTAVVNQRLASFEDEARTELATQAAVFRRQAEQEAARREQAISELSAQYEQNLRAAQEERSRQESDLQARQAELQSQIRHQSEQAQNLERERAAATAELARLQDTLRREQLVVDQLLTMYDSVNRELAAGRDDRALESLASMRAYFDKEPARSLPGIQKRRPVEMFLIGSLEQLTRERARREEAPAASLIETAERVAALNSQAASAEERFRASDFAAARRMYLAALSELPAAKSSQAGLEQVAALEAQRLRQSFDGLASEGAALAVDSRFDESLQRFRQALAVLLGDRGAADRLVNQIAEASLALRPAAAPAGGLEAEQRRQEQLVNEQILAAYTAVNRSLQGGNYNAALQELAGLRAGLDREPARSLAAVQQRRPVELFLIGSLEELIAARRREGEQAKQTGSALAQGETSYRQGLYQASLDQYRQALELLLADKAAAARVVSQVAEAGYRLQAAPLVTEVQEARSREAARKALQERLSALRTEYAQQRSRSARTSQASGETLATLLQAKLLTLQILSSEQVSSRYPQLYDQMQKYLDTFAEQQLLDGGYSGLQDAVDLLAAALGEPAPDKSRLLELWRRFSHTDRADLLTQLLARLEKLLR